eukprot:1161958-Pelagomonas_calceolata.AAC.8
MCRGAHRSTCSDSGEDGKMPLANYKHTLTEAVWFTHTGNTSKCRYIGAGGAAEVHQWGSRTARGWGGMGPRGGMDVGKNASMTICVPKLQDRRGAPVCKLGHSMGGKGSVFLSRLKERSSGRRGCRCSGILDHPTHGCPPHHAVHTLIDKTSVLTPLLQVAMLSSLAHPARSRLLAGVCAELTHSHAEAACNMANSGHATTACVAFENNPK